MQRQRVNEIMTCAQFCTRNPQCNWFNFKSRDQVERGFCELIRAFDSRSIEKDPSWTFSELVKQPVVLPSLPSNFNFLDFSLKP